MAEFYPLLFGRGFSLPQLLFFFAASPHPCAGPQYRPAGQATLRIALGAACGRPHPGFAGGPAGRLAPAPSCRFFSPPGSIAVRRAVNIYYQ